MTSTVSHQTTHQDVHLQATSLSSLTKVKALTYQTTSKTLTTKLDTLPDEILLNIAEFTGAHSCYLGYGAVNKTLNQIFNTYNGNKLSKSTSYGGYAPFQEIVMKCEKELENEIEYKSWKFPTVYHQLASGAITFNREDLLNWAIEKQNKFIHQEICERALQDEKLSIFKKVWNRITNENTMTHMKEQVVFIYIAADKGYLDWLIYLHEELECECDYSPACTAAAIEGYIDCLKYLHEQGCELDEYACLGAAFEGHLDCLIYLHEKGCPWNNEACSEAARYGHLDCLQYMRENGLEWDQYDKYLGSIAKGSDL